jgi:probable rRNA maturation factor
VHDQGLRRWLASVAPASIRGDVAIALATNARVRALNDRYRRTSSPTDVLSFPSGDRTFLGDIVIATGVARRQARERGHDYRTELRVLALHGLLHLLGYDHEARGDGGLMARVEARLRRKGGLGESLIDRSTSTEKRLRFERAAGLPAEARARLRQGYGGQPSRESGAKVGGQRRGAAPASEREWGWGPTSTKK